MSASALPVVRLGDSSSHGGAVTGSSSFVRVEGIYQARNGDEFTCGIPSHNPATVGPLMSVASDEGMDVAKDGDSTSCGATLIATQTTVKVGQGFIRMTSPPNGASY